MGKSEVQIESDKESDMAAPTVFGLCSDPLRLLFGCTLLLLLIEYLFDGLSGRVDRPIIEASARKASLSNGFRLYR